MLDTRLVRPYKAYKPDRQKAATRIPPCHDHGKQSHAIFPPFFGFVFGMPFSGLFGNFGVPVAPPLSPFGHFGRILGSILAPFWLILAPFGILFFGLDLASIFD